MRRRIAHINSSGKWAEVWFGDEYVPGSRYNECCKWYMLHRVVNGYDPLNDDAFNEPDCEEPDDHGIPGRVLNHGYVGLWVTWEKGKDYPTRFEANPPKATAGCLPDQRGDGDVT